MPNLVTHYLCGLEAVKKIENIKCRGLINKFPKVFYLGTQGPDILFFHEIWPWSLKKFSANIGNTIHISKVNLLFKAIFEYIIKQNDYVKNILTVYFMGFLCHNCMDSLGHPYIYYSSGFTTEKDSNENKYICYHRKFETSIDVLMCDRLLNRKVHEIHPYELIRVSPSEQNMICEMYTNVINSVFNIHIPKKDISKAINDMITVEKICRDPHGIKEKIVSRLDAIIYGFPLYSSIIFPLKLTDGLDYLNLENREWCMPHDENIKSRLSFIDLFNEACQRTQRFCDVLYSCIFYNKSGISYALKLFGNTSYLSGIDCDIPAKFKYHNIIFKNPAKERKKAKPI
ncbi:zinc dependent phospholipase C [Ruminiclostridium sufflavum DSM 19573]|uniref:Zinc dependent phospholipase C n=1 Tax=Ruminiclostridium sufflavum DSM 19573 TaxID=1121337 RepID=A0A318Y5H7_9FIRM|nr:zinc dependent phospholipase C family protein [Ruminiclostridium sufflavum]PYG87246.1 zinc dependent phospholipase C [Ruminiclostridium sufflavum DSM 19573]